MSVLLIFYFSIGLFNLEAPAQAAVCFRPQDMSNQKAVELYVSCRKKLEVICEKTPKNLDCGSLKKPVDLQRRFPPNVDDIDPQARCTVYRDGSYRCLQDPIRFVAKQRTNEGTISIPSPTPEPVSPENPAAPSNVQPSPTRGVTPSTSADGPAKL
jgi:hypothetical protein